MTAIMYRTADVETWAEGWSIRLDPSVAICELCGFR
jgi:hypothetical protein